MIRLLDLVWECRDDGAVNVTGYRCSRWNRQSQLGAHIRAPAEPRTVRVGVHQIRDAHNEQGGRSDPASGGVGHPARRSVSWTLGRARGTSPLRAVGSPCAGGEPSGRRRWHHEARER